MSTTDISVPTPGIESIPEAWRHYIESDAELEEIEELVRRKVTLVETDGKPMDSEWHRLCMELLLNVIHFHFRDREDYYAGGNMIVYYSEQQARNRDFCGPDFFYIHGVSRAPMRDYWCVWEEDGRTPEYVIELLSRSTAKKDLTVKKELYRTILRSPEYVCYDNRTGKLIGWRLNGHDYLPLEPSPEGRLWSTVLNLFVGPWDGEYVRRQDRWLRFFDKDGNLIPTREEWHEQQAVRAEQESVNIKQEAANIKQEAANINAENARLKALLAEKGITP